jgi:hypothetical protein
MQGQSGPLAMSKEERCEKIERYVGYINFSLELLNKGWDVGAVECRIAQPCFDGYTTFCHNCFSTIGIGRFYRK